MKVLRFFLTHSLRDMWRNRARTVFALLCVATGVAAVVSLRSLAFMIADELTTNLAELNRGDIRVTATRDVPELVELTPQGDPVFTREAIQTMHEWADEESSKITMARMAGTMQIRRISNGMVEASNVPVLTLYIEPDLYPFYDTIQLTQPADQPLSNAFAGPNTEASTVATILGSKLAAAGAVSLSPMPTFDLMVYPVYLASHPRSLVISSNLMRQSSLGLRQGDIVRVGAADTLYQVTGVAPSSSETILTNPSPQMLFLDYLYLPITDLPFFGESALPNQVFIKVPLGESVDSAESNLVRYLYARIDIQTDLSKQLRRTSVTQLEDQNSETADTIGDMILVMGLSSLLIGGIGIINTMLVVVSRRTLEIAVLKTLGLKGYRITALFLVEAFLMGLIGSLIGAAVGVFLSYAIKSVGEKAFGISLVWRLYPRATIEGLILGVLMTMLFGFLPTLIAGQVRPAIVLRPNEAQTPPAGLVQVLVTLIAMIIALGVLVNTIVEDALTYSPVYMLAGAGTLFGLFAGVIAANTPAARYFDSRLGQRRAVVIFGGLVVGAALASGIILLLSELWRPTGLGTVKPAGHIVGILKRGDWNWAALWSGITILIMFGIGRLAQSRGGLTIGLAAIGVCIAGVIGLLIGMGGDAFIADTGVWAFLGRTSTGIVLVEGALALLAVVFAGYWLLIWLVGRMPASGLIAIVSLTLVGLSIGWLGTGRIWLIFSGAAAVVLWLVLLRRYKVDARLVLREMDGRRSRVASTLLGLSVGITGLSVIALTTNSTTRLLESQLEGNAEGNLLVVAQRPEQRDAIRDILMQADGVEEFSQFSTYYATLLEVDGEKVDLSRHGRPESEEEGTRLVLSERADLNNLPDFDMLEGRNLRPSDANQPNMVVRRSIFSEELGIHTGTQLLFRFDNGPGTDDDVQIVLTVVGIITSQSEQSAFGDRYLVPPGALPSGIAPMNVITIAMVDESNDAYMDQLLISISDVPGAMAIEISALTDWLKGLIDQLKAIPTLVAWLALLAGTAIIANTVALATQERRRQIGVMKAVGLKGRRVLIMLMIENGLIGLIAGLIGLGVGLMITVIQVLTVEDPNELKQVIDFSTMGWLMLMSIGVSVGAAILSAWSAAAEKPMNVLRYE